MSTPPPTAPRHRAVVVERPSWLQRHALHLGSVLLGILAAVVGFAYRVPALTRPVPRPGARTYSLVQFIDGLGPYWTIGFFIAGLLLVLAPIRPVQLGDIAHSVATGVHGMLATAAWIGWALSDPSPTVLGSVALTGLTVAHFVFAVVYRWPSPDAES